MGRALEGPRRNGEGLEAAEVGDEELGLGEDEGEGEMLDVEVGEELDA